MTADPTERYRQWLGFVLLSGLTLIVLVVVPWELIVRHGQDPGVWSATVVLISIILLGPLGIKITRSNSNGKKDL